MTQPPALTARQTIGTDKDDSVTIPPRTGPYESGIPELIVAWLTTATPADVLLFGEIVDHLVTAELDDRLIK